MRVSSRWFLTFLHVYSYDIRLVTVRSPAHHAHYPITGLPHVPVVYIRYYIIYPFPSSFLIVVYST